MRGMPVPSSSPPNTSLPGSGRDRVLIRVSDSGPGLPEVELERIFTPFYRPEKSRTRESGGAGLGLAIVKSSVEACHGSVSCRNRSPSGLIVEIELRAAAKP